MSYSLLINGLPLPPFQGDTISPYLFAIVMEYLNRCLMSVKEVEGFGFHPKCKRTNTIALLFVDDVLIFYKGGISLVNLIKEQLESFERTSGLVVNLEKCVTYMKGVDADQKKAIREILGMPLGTLTFKYLGVPISHKKLTYSQCLPLIEKIYSRIVQ